MKFSRKISAILLLLTIVFTVSCSSRNSDSILVFAAASLDDALQTIKTSYEAEYESRIIFSFGGSQKLARQISLGANPDIILSAGLDPITFLDDRNLLNKQRYNVLTNNLVLVSKADIANRIKNLDDLTSSKISRIAVADPDTSPAGVYALQALNNLDLNDSLKSKVVTGENVRIALTYVERGNADVAIVYRTDAILAEELYVLDIIPLQAYDQVLYVAATTKSSGNLGEALNFCEFLLGEGAQEVFKDYGFSFP